MKALQTYIDNKNMYAKLMQGRGGVSSLYEVRTAAGRQRVADMIDSALSPENLSCDGELSRTETNRRYRELTTVGLQLTKLDPSVKIYELYTGE